MAGGEHVLTEVKGAIASITLNRADAGNAITRDMGASMRAFLSEVAGDQAVKLVVIRAKGDDFCVGRDAGGPPPGTPAPAFWRNSAKGFLGLYRQIESLPIPVICGVRGAVYSTGCAIASAADITLAADDARFALTDMKNDTPPLLVMSALLRAAPSKAIGHMAYGAGDVDATMAVRYGLASDVVPVAALDAALDDLAKTLAGKPRPALGAVKHFANIGARMDGMGAAEYAANTLASVVSSTAR